MVKSIVREDIQAVVNVSRDKSENSPERKFWKLIRQAFLPILILRRAYCFELIKRNMEKNKHCYVKRVCPKLYLELSK